MLEILLAFIMGWWFRPIYLEFTNHLIHKLNEDTVKAVVTEYNSDGDDYRSDSYEVKSYNLGISEAKKAERVSFNISKGGFYSYC